MTYQEIEDQLPNGLHDAGLLSINLDFMRAVCNMELSLLVGLPSGLTEEEKYARRSASIVFKGLHSFIMEPHEDELNDPEGLFIVAGPLPDEKVTPPPSFNSLPSGVFALWIFLNDNNSFIYLAAREAELVWKECK